MRYLGLPLVLRDGYLPSATLLESITYSVGLLLSTRKGQLPFDPDYGSILWNSEFSEIQSSNKAEFRSGLRDAIQKYEKRLSSVVVSFEASTEPGRPGTGVAVKVTGEYSENGNLKPFEVTYNLG